MVKLFLFFKESQAITFIFAFFFGSSLFNIANQIILKRISFFGALAGCHKRK